MMANMATMAMAMAMAMAMGLSGIVDYLCLCVGCTRHQTRDAKSWQQVMARTGKMQLHHDIDCNRDCDCGFVAEVVNPNVWNSAIVKMKVRADLFVQAISAQVELEEE